MECFIFLFILHLMIGIYLSNREAIHTTCPAELHSHPKIRLCIHGWILNLSRPPLLYDLRQYVGSSSLFTPFYFLFYFSLSLSFSLNGSGIHSVLRRENTQRGSGLMAWKVLEDNEGSPKIIITEPGGSTAEVAGCFFFCWVFVFFIIIWVFELLISSRFPGSFTWRASGFVEKW